MDVFAAGGQVLGDGHRHPRAIGEPTHRLDQALAEGFLADHNTAVVVLNGARKDLAGAGAAFIDQHHQRRLGEGTAAGPLHIADPITGGAGDDDAFIQPLSGDFNTRHQQAAGVAAQVEHKTADALTTQFGDGVAHVLGRIGVELLQADVAHLGAIGGHIHAGINGRQFDPVADQIHRHEFTGAAAEFQHHFGADLAANQLDRVFGGHASGAFAVDGGDHIFGLHPRP